VQERDRLLTQGRLPAKKCNAQAGRRGDEPEIKNSGRDRMQSGRFHKNLREGIKHDYGKQ
jgi:hypothetical protein